MGHSREDAVTLVLAAFRAAAPQRVNTSHAATMADGATALRILGVTSAEMQAALTSMGYPVLEWCGNDDPEHQPHYTGGSAHQVGAPVALCSGRP